MVNEMLTEWNTQFDDYFNMEPLSDNELASRVSSGNYQIAICSITPESSGPLAVLNLFRSDNPNNPAHLRSAGFDENLANAENQRPLFLAPQWSGTSTSNVSFTPCSTKATILPPLLA